jgi:hypothetical protein
MTSDDMSPDAVEVQFHEHGDLVLNDDCDSVGSETSTTPSVVGQPKYQGPLSASSYRLKHTKKVVPFLIGALLLAVVVAVAIFFSQRSSSSQQADTIATPSPEKVAPTTAPTVGLESQSTRLKFWLELDDNINTTSSPLQFMSNQQSSDFETASADFFTDTISNALPDVMSDWGYKLLYIEDIQVHVTLQMISNSTTLAVQTKVEALTLSSVTFLSELFLYMVSQHSAGLLQYLVTTPTDTDDQAYFESFQSIRLEAMNATT